MSKLPRPRYVPSDRDVPDQLQTDLGFVHTDYELSSHGWKYGTEDPQLACESCVADGVCCVTKPLRRDNMFTLHLRQTACRRCSQLKIKCSIANGRHSGDYYYVVDGKLFRNRAPTREEVLLNSPGTAGDQRVSGQSSTHAGASHGPHSPIVCENAVGLGAHPYALTPHTWANSPPPCAPPDPFSSASPSPHPWVPAPFAPSNGVGGAKQSGDGPPSLEPCDSKSAVCSPEPRPAPTFTVLAKAEIPLFEKYVIEGIKVTANDLPMTARVAGMSVEQIERRLSMDRDHLLGLVREHETEGLCRDDIGLLRRIFENGMIACGSGTVELPKPYTAAEVFERTSDDSRRALTLLGLLSE